MTGNGRRQVAAHRSHDESPLGPLLRSAFVRAAAQRWRLLCLLCKGGPVATVGLLAAHLAAVALPALTALTSGHLLAAVAPPPDVGRLALAVGLLAGLMLAGKVGEAAREVLGILVAQRVDGHLRHLVRDIAGSQTRIERLESAQFQDDAARASDPGTGAATGRNRSAGTAAIGQLTVTSLMLSGIGSAAVLAAFSPVLAGALFAVSLVIRSALRRQWARVTRTLDASTGGQRRVWYWSELGVGGAAKEIRLFGLAGWLGGRYRATAYATGAPAWRQLWRALRRQWWTAVLAGVSAATALGLPARAVLDGAIQPHAMVTYVLAGLGIFAISVVGQETFDIERGSASVEAANRLRARYTGGATTSPRLPDKPHPAVAPLVRFEDVVFAYPGARRKVLDGLYLTLRPGENLAIVGENGAGKTTFVKLLAGLYAPSAGRITVDGVDLADLDQAAWRRQIVAVFQDFVHYPASLADNVALAAPERIGDRAAISDAIRRAGGVDLLAELPDGLDASLWNEGAGGTDLSGGQWQRVALARALFATAAGRRMVVLDEPTANLDPRAEASFHARVVGALSGVTTVLISHRLSTVRPADRIVLLRDGRAAEVGTHDELIALGGGYARFFDLQAAAFIGGRR